eukprot:evm.model.scf_1357.3 EVM.evm.TU.scf_1357.3   scf_1357:31823-34903(-)
MRAVSSAEANGSFRYDWQSLGCRLVAVGMAFVHSCEFVRDFGELLLYSRHSIQNDTALGRSLGELVEVYDVSWIDDRTIHFDRFMGLGLCLEDVDMTCNEPEIMDLAQPRCEKKAREMVTVEADKESSKVISTGQTMGNDADIKNDTPNESKSAVTGTVVVAILGSILLVTIAVLYAFWKRALMCPWEQLDGAESAASEEELGGNALDKDADFMERQGPEGSGRMKQNFVEAPNGKRLDGLDKPANPVPTTREFVIGAISAEADGIKDTCAIVERRIASGGNGVVYKGQWKGIPVAIKTVIFQDNANGKNKQRQRVVYEAAISSSVAHRNLVQTYTYSFKKLQSESLEMPPSRRSKDPRHVDIVMGGKCSEHAVDWKLYIVQEFCDGGSLRECLDNQKAMDATGGRPKLGVICRIAFEVAAGMCHLHKQHNIVHGDLTSKNILFKKESGDDDPNGLGTAKIADFGLSMKMAKLQSHISNQHAGTPFYMAPELCHKGVLSKKADVFSFGVLMWELYHSRKCYQASNAGMQYHPRFPKFPTVCPLLYAMLCVVCLSPKPEDRPDFDFIVKVFASMRRQFHSGKFSDADELRANNRGVAAGLGRMTAGKILELIAQQADIPLDEIFCSPRGLRDHGTGSQSQLGRAGSSRFPRLSGLLAHAAAVNTAQEDTGEDEVHLSQAYISPFHCVVTVSPPPRPEGGVPRHDDIDFLWRCDELGEGGPIPEEDENCGIVAMKDHVRAENKRSKRRPAGPGGPSRISLGNVGNSSRSVYRNESQ